MWSFNDSGAYWVNTITLVNPELTQLDSVKSMILNLPANGTAGLARTLDSKERRSPSPPARMTASVRLTPRCYTPSARPTYPMVRAAPGTHCPAQFGRPRS